MIYHYVNLACWEDIATNFDRRYQQTLFCDSISMKLVMWLFGHRNVLLVPGSSTLSKIEAELEDRNVLFLLARTAKNSEIAKSLVLPVEANFSAIPAELIDLIDVSDFNSIYIGISSPKQNTLSYIIADRYPDLEIRCVGAVLGSVGVNKHIFLLHKSASSSGFEWLFHLIKTPRRTLKKLWLILIAMSRLAVSRPRRALFNELCNNITRVN